MSEDERYARHGTPPRSQLPLDAEVDEVIQIVNLIPVNFPLFLFYRTNKVPERLLVTISER
jgi:hypothetical protein